MKKPFITVSALLVILLLSLVISSCTSQEEITTVVTGTDGPTTIVINNEPPEIPHAYIPDIEGIEFIPLSGRDPICFSCHPIPDQHTDWWLDETTCEKCHVVSDNPILVKT